jgi:hypothetical protein
MQIGHFNHLNFPRGSKLPLSANTDDSTAAANGAATPGLGATAPAPELTPPPDVPGVVLKLQSDAAAANARLDKWQVYTDGRKAAANGNTSNDTDGDIERMAKQYNEAVLRNAGNSTTLAVDKDGVLVAGAASAATSKPADFVTFAVSAMRDYADEQERLRAASQTNGGTSAASLIPRSLAEVQKLASRFKLFA